MFNTGNITYVVLSCVGCIYVEIVSLYPIFHVLYRLKIYCFS